MNPWQLWVEALDDPIGKWIISTFVLLTLIAIAVYVVKWFRDMAVGGSDDGLGQWSDFEQLHAEGKLSQWEYQRLKSTVPKRLAEKMLNDPHGSSELSDVGSPLNDITTVGEAGTAPIKLPVHEKQLKTAELETPDFEQAINSDIDDQDSSGLANEGKQSGHTE